MRRRLKSGTGAGASGVEVNADHSEARRDATRRMWHVKGGGWKKREQGRESGRRGRQGRPEGNQGVIASARRMSRHNPKTRTGRRTQGMLISSLLPAVLLSLLLKAFRHDARSRATVARLHGVTMPQSSRQFFC